MSDMATTYRIRLAWERRRLAVSEWWYVLRNLCVDWSGDLTAHWEPTAEMAGAFYLPTPDNGRDEAQR